MLKKIIFSVFLLSVAHNVIGNGAPKLSPQDIAKMPLASLEKLQSDLKMEIDRVIGEAKCTSNKQCHALAIGANPCGGPESYRAYSTLETNTEKLLELADLYKAVRKTLHAKMGTMGACIVIPEPKVQCRNQQCVTSKPSKVLIF